MNIIEVGNIRAELVHISTDEYHSLVLRTPLEPEQALHGKAILRIAAKSVTRLSGISNDTTALQKLSKFAVIHLFYQRVMAR